MPDLELSYICRWTLLAPRPAPATREDRCSIVNLWNFTSSNDRHVAR